MPLREGGSESDEPLCLEEPHVLYSSGRFSDSRIFLLAAPSRDPFPVAEAAFVPAHGGGTVPDFHRLPFPNARIIEPSPQTVNRFTTAEIVIRHRPVFLDLYGGFCRVRHWKRYYMDITNELAARRRKIESVLQEHLPEGPDVPAGLADALRYAAMGGGKRLRPILCLCTAEALQADPDSVMLSACGIELVHTSSLLLDDLPCMDDHATRRGKATTHKVYGESDAILASMAALCHGIDLVAQNAAALECPKASALEAIREISLAVGARGLSGGQHLDLQSQINKVDLNTLQQIHHLKTGVLFTAAVAVPAMLLQAPEQTIDSLRSFSRRLGQAFQISDDIIDVAEDRAFDTPVRHMIGANLAGTLGIPAARGLVNDLIASAKADIAELGESAGLLIGLADLIRERND